MTFTKEQLQHIIETDHVQCGEASALARIALASLEAEAVCYLTWHQGFRAPDDCEEYVVEANPGDKSCDGSPAFPVYAAPPAPVSVPDENGLLPCPCCGGNAEFDYDDDNLNWISCNVCGISTDTAYHTDVDARDKLREVWNRRAAMLQGAEHLTEAYKLPGDFESFISWLTGGNGIPDWLINGDKIDDEKVSFLLKVYRAGAHGAVGNSPVIPDGWVMVPVEPTEEMWQAALDATGVVDSYKAMLAAAPQQEVNNG